MDDWRSAIEAMQNGQMPQDPVEQRGNNKKQGGGGGRQKPSRFNQDKSTNQNNRNSNQNNKNKQQQRGHGTNLSKEELQRAGQYVGMSQTEVYKSLKKTNTSHMDNAMPNINDELGMIDELNDEFSNYKRIQENYRQNPMKNEMQGQGSSLMSRGGMGAGGSMDYGGNMMSDDRGMGGNQSGQMGRGGQGSGMSRYQGNMNEQMNKVPSRYDSDQRMVNESMNSGNNRGDGQERYSPSKMYDSNDHKYGGGGSDKSQEQLLDQLKGMLGGNLMNASPEIMRLIQEKEDELKRINKGNTFDSQRGNQDRADEHLVQSSRAPANDRGNSWQQQYPEEDQALSNAMFNDPSALRSMDNNTKGRMGMDIDNNWSMMSNPSMSLMENSSMGMMGRDISGLKGMMGLNSGSMMGMENSSMGLMGLDTNSSSYQTSFMENQFSAPAGRRTLLGDTPLEQRTMNEGFNNFGAGSGRGGERGGAGGGGGGIWNNQRFDDRRSMPDLKEELRTDLNYRFKSGLKSLGPRKEESVLNFDWKCFHASDYDGINPKYLRCFDCDIKVRDSESFIRHITGMKHRGQMSDVEKKSTTLLREYRKELKEFEENMGKNSKEMANCALCECKVAGPIKTHRAQNRHKALKGFVHPFCKFCAKEFDGRPEYEVHKFHPEHISNNERENIQMPFTSMGDEDFLAALKELRKDNQTARSKQKQNRDGERSSDRSRDRDSKSRKEGVIRGRKEDDKSGKKKDDKRSNRKDDIKKRDDDIIEVVVIDKKPEKKSLMESLEMGNLDEYNGSKGVGRDFLRPVTGYFCRACKKLLPTEEESVAHMKSKLHWDACVKADKSKALKRPAPAATNSDGATPAKKPALSKSVEPEEIIEDPAPVDDAPIDTPAVVEVDNPASNEENDEKN